MERKRNRQENERCGRKEKEKRKGKYTQREGEREKERERMEAGEKEETTGWKGEEERERAVEEEGRRESARERERRSGIASTLAVPQWYRAATPPFAPTVPLLPLLRPTHPAYIIHPHYEPPLGSVIALYSLCYVHSNESNSISLSRSLRFSDRFLSFSTPSILLPRVSSSPSQPRLLPFTLGPVFALSIIARSSSSSSSSPSFSHPRDR